MYDVIIVGAGVAGSYLAAMLPEKLSVAVIDMAEKPVIKDSGIVCSKITEVMPESKTFIKKKIRQMTLVSPSGHEVVLKRSAPFAYMLERDRFGSFLRKSAKRHSEIIYDAVVDVRIGGDRAYVITKDNLYEAKIIVGADGANSVVRQKIFRANEPRTYYGLLSRTRPRQKGIRIYLNKLYSPDFFAWTIEGAEAGLVTALRPKEHFETFAADQDFRLNNMVSACIPTGLIKTFANRCVLVGDAGAQVKPVTGGGIMYSLQCAGIAADNITKAFMKHRFDEYTLSYYHHDWLAKFKREILFGLLFRKIYRRMSNRQIDNLFNEFGNPLEEIVYSVDEFDYDKPSRIVFELFKNNPTSAAKAFLKNML